MQPANFCRQIDSIRREMTWRYSLVGLGLALLVSLPLAGEAAAQSGALHPASSPGFEPLHREHLGLLQQGFPVPIPPGPLVPAGGYMTEGVSPPTESLWPADDWVQPVVWDGGVELGINASDGNTEAFSLRAGANLARETEAYELAFDLSYARSTADRLETQHNGLMNALFEQSLGDSRWSIVDKVGLEYDEFKAFDVRLWLNAGLGYELIESDALDLKGRVGAGASREIGGPTDVWVPEAVFGIDYEHQLNERQRLVAAVDYFPAWEDFSDYRLVTVVGWEVLLDEQNDLSLKLSLNDRYDSTPSGRRANDVSYAVLLLWKL